MAKKQNEPLKIEDDPNFYRGFGEFTFPNGDTYVGDYCAHRSGLIWREGHGVYTTQDGQMYEGEWYDDKLVENKEIIVAYPNGAQYQGPISKNKYQGPGTYVLETNMNVSCQFVGNKPVGTVTLIDCQGKLWRGTANENSAILLPENVFYLNLNEFKGKGLPRMPIDTSDMHPSSSESSERSEYDLPDKLWEELIFAKSQLTKNDVDFTDSKWWKNYVKYKDKYNEMQRKIEENVSLNDDDLKWIQEFKSFKNKQESRKYEKQLERMKEEERVFGLNEIFQSKDFKESCPPVKVFYPKRGHPPINKPKSFDGTIEGDEELDPLDSSDMIYVNSHGQVQVPPSNLQTFPIKLSVESNSFTSSTESKEVELLTVQFQDFKYRRDSIRPDAFRDSIADCKMPYDDEQEELHFTKFREELLLDAKKGLDMEKKYQEEKLQKLRNLEKIRSKESDGSKMKLRSNEKLQSSRSRDHSTRIFDQVSNNVTLLPPLEEERNDPISLIVKNCVEKLAASSKMKTQTATQMESQTKVHTHDVGDTTESLTGIPRELLLKSKFRKKWM